MYITVKPYIDIQFHGNKAFVEIDNMRCEYENVSLVNLEPEPTIGDLLTERKDFKKFRLRLFPNNVS